MHPTTKTQLESMMPIMTSSNYTTNSIDSIVKSCLDRHDPQLRFEAKPYLDTLRGINYLIFPATIVFLPQESATFRCHNCGTTSFYRNGFTPKHFIRVLSVNRHIKPVSLLVQLGYEELTTLIILFV